MKKPIHALGAAVAASLAATAADAATYSMTLKAVTNYVGPGPYAGNITSSSATWSYDTVTGLLSQTGGTFNARFTIVPTTTLFRHSITGLVVGNGAAASASTFVCTDGNFGATVAASLCGAYNFGANAINESTATWGPGLAFGRTIGGDDLAVAPYPGGQQNLHHPVYGYDGFSLISWVGTTLTLSNAACNPASPGNANGCATLGGYNTGYIWTLAPIPIAPAVWLFGSAMAALGVARHRAQKSG